MVLALSIPGRDGRLSLFVTAPAILLLLASLGCATTPAGKADMRTGETFTVAAAFVRDEVHQRKSSAVPDELVQDVVESLERRGLDVRLIGDDGYHESVAAVRTTPGRLAALAREADDEVLMVLVETRATFYSQLSGRYRWTVDARLSLAPAADPGGAFAADVQAPAFLFYDHEREDEAVAEVAGRISREVNALVDEMLDAGMPETLNGEGGSETKPSASGEDAPKGAVIGDWTPLAPTRSDAIYFAMIDRFARSDDSDGTNSPDDPHSFWGGDIDGMRERLDWLEDLGVGTLWISPVYLSREDDFHGWGAFHGYWVEDHKSIWTRLGTFDELRGLSDDLRNRGMRLLLDIVVNHVGYDAPLMTERPEWFNRRGPIADWSCPEQLLYHDVHGLPDLDQHNPEVYDYLLDHALFWIDRVRPDGFRLDAVKHVPMSFWARFNADVKEHAGDDFYLLGEDLDGDPVGLAETLHHGGFDALFDFPVHFALRDVFCEGASLGRLASVLSMDHLYGPDAGERMVTFLDNHDLPRIAGLCGGDTGRVKKALLSLVGLRGAPAITWGTEIGLDGVEEPENRAPMRFDYEHPMREKLARALAVRKSHPRLLDADSVFERVEDDAMVLIRLSTNPVVLAVNRGEEPLEVRAFDAPVETGRSLLNGEVFDGDIKVPPRSVRLVELQPSCTESMQRHLQQIANEHGTTLQPGSPRKIVLRLSGPPNEEGRIVLAGAGEALGHWDVERAPGFEEDVAVVELPSGLVAEYKLARRTETETRWEEGPNRYLLVPPGEEPLELDLEWRREG